MSKYIPKFTKHALRDFKSLSPKLKQKLWYIIVEILLENPFDGKKLHGDKDGEYSYRLTIKDRIVYRVDQQEKVLYFKRVRSHYGD